MAGPSHDLEALYYLSRGAIQGSSQFHWQSNLVHIAGMAMHHLDIWSLRQFGLRCPVNMCMQNIYI